MINYFLIYFSFNYGISEGKYLGGCYGQTKQIDTMEFYRQTYSRYHWTQTQIHIDSIVVVSKKDYHSFGLIDLYTNK